MSQKSYSEFDDFSCIIDGGIDGYAGELKKDFGEFTYCDAMISSRLLPTNYYLQSLAWAVVTLARAHELAKAEGVAYSDASALTLCFENSRQRCRRRIKPWLFLALSFLIWVGCTFFCSLVPR